jgi:hypothetical protein
LRALGYPTYDSYVRGAWWRRRRREFARSHPAECACCGWTDGVELHHRSYERVGAERDDDLCWLCSRCHSLLHQLVDEGVATLDEVLHDPARAARVYGDKYRGYDARKRLSDAVDDAEARIVEARRERQRARIPALVLKSLRARIALAEHDGDTDLAAALRIRERGARHSARKRKPRGRAGLIDALIAAQRALADHQGRKRPSAEWRSRERELMQARLDAAARLARHDNNHDLLGRLEAFARRHDLVAPQSRRERRAAAETAADDAW